MSPVDYAYYADGQLQGADYDYAFGGPTDDSYTYDDNGNRTGAGYVVDAFNRIQSDGTYTYLYDAEGNRTRTGGTAKPGWFFGGHCT